MLACEYLVYDITPAPSVAKLLWYNIDTLVIIVFLGQ